MPFKLIFFFILIFVSHTQARNEDSLRTDNSTKDSITTDYWFSPDKGRHIVGSMMTTILLSKIGQTELNLQKGDARVIGVSVTLSLGIGKEFIDQKNPHNFFSLKDLTADIAGIILGLILLEIH